jgi:tetratricopeptide (TPR) repeat protein
MLCLLHGASWRAVAAAQSSGSPPATSAAVSHRNPAEIFSQGKQALQSGQLELAQRCFREVIVLDPKSSAAYVNLGVTYMREKRWDEALTELRKAESLSPGEPGIQLNIGLAYYRKNDFSAAIAPLSATLERAHDSVQARYLLGLCFFFTNRYQDAAQTLTPLWDKESSNLNYLYALSIAASKSSNSALQKRAFDQLLLVGQDRPEFHLYLGKAYLAEDDTTKALDEFRAAAAAQPNLPMVHYFLGRTYLQQHAYPEAEAELMKDAAIEPEVAYNYEDLGILYVQLNQPEKAEKYFLKAIGTNATLVNSYFGLAKLYRQTGRYQDSLKMLDHAVALAPQSASVHYLRGQVLAKLGQSANAKQEFDSSAQLLKSFNDRLQEDPLGDRSADAQDAAQQ